LVSLLELQKPVRFTFTALNQNRILLKKYTFHLLVLTVATALLGFTGLDFSGDKFVRILCLFAGIGLMISCADAVIVSRKKRRS